MQADMVKRLTCGASVLLHIFCFAGSLPSMETQSLKFLSRLWKLISITLKSIGAESVKKVGTSPFNIIP